MLSIAFRCHKEEFMKEKKLSKYACLNEQALRLKEEQDYQYPYFEDVNRIVFSYSYMRYSDKTQVFAYSKSDHITKRMHHVQMVSLIARRIGRALGLNEDLIEAASLAHDLGHVPFGHFGESVLNEISLNHNEGYFHHNIESVRLLMDLEKKGEGLNLCVQVLDAVMCHNGEFLEGEYYPALKDQDQFLKEYHQSYVDPEITKKLRPMTLEGCVVRISDIIAYLGRDIDDACSLNLLKKNQIPYKIRNVLGIHNKDISETIINDLITNSLGKPYLKLSPKVYEAMKQLKAFNYQHIYEPSLTADQKKFIKEAFYTVYESCLADLRFNNLKADIFRLFVNHKNDVYRQNNTLERIALDYVAGMTDDFLIDTYETVKISKNVYNKKEVSK